MTMELGGTNSWLYDQFNLTGTFNFSGSLNVSLVNGYTPLFGDSFDLFGFGAGVGAFSSMNLPALGPALYWNTNSLYSTGEIKVDAATGSLQVTILPTAVATNGAQWRVDASAWQSSGTTVSNLVVGTHTVSFSSVAGWVTATSQVVTVTGTNTATATGTYWLKAQMLAPTPGSLLTNTVVAFAWNAGIGPSQYALWVAAHPTVPTSTRCSRAPTRRRR